MHYIMTLPSRRGALHFLAHIATDDIQRPKSSQPLSPHLLSPEFSSQRLCPMDSAIKHYDPALHRSKKQQHTPHPTGSNSSPKHPTPPLSPAEDTVSSSSSSSSPSPPPPPPPPSARTTRSSRKKVRGSGVRPELENKLELRKKRKQMLQRAMEIKSLDNSPVNDRQLLVLKMVYNEITMYPSESWMVILAIIIHRAFKQVKNWFSNERQKRGRPGEVVSFQTESGDKLRLRPSALGLHKDWSDDFFEEVVMIHNYRVLCNSRWQTGRALSDTSSNFDGHS